MSAANGTALRPLTPIEEKAVQLAKDGVTLSAITAQTRLSAELIAVALERHSEWEQLRSGAKTTRAYVKRDAPERVEADLNAPPAVPEVLPAPRPAVVEPARKLSSGALLIWADQQGPARAKTLAARIRESLTELYRLHAGDAARAEAAAEVDRLTAELAAAKARLKDVGSKTTTAKPAVSVSSGRPEDSLSRTAVVRAWARDNDHDIAPLGRIPRPIQEAYDAAHKGES